MKRDSKPDDPDQVSKRRDEAIKRALRTPPTQLKDLKKRPPKSGPASPKRDGA
jgi:hypothetical protein